MWIHEVAPERLAELFHHYHQALMPEVSGKGSEGRDSWKEVPPQEKSRLVAAARLALLELESMASDRGEVKRAVFCPAGRGRMGLLSSRRIETWQIDFATAEFRTMFVFMNSLGIP